MKLNKKITWINIIYGVLLITVGTLAFVFSIVNPEKVKNVVSYSIATCLFLLGIIFIVTSLLEETNKQINMSLFMGSLVIALGTVLCIDTSLVTSFFLYFLSIFLIALGLIGFIKMIAFIKYKEKVSLIVAFGVASALVITLGALGLAYIGPASKIIFGALGVILLILGIIEIVIGIKLLSKNKNNIKDADMQEITPKVIEHKKKK